ncbi:hypothetical protein XELAEV_18028744mg [Xenopus laevis]|uniref:Glycosyl hydrolase family 13 catalytic domain-containing protein n=1 Tax=Xenopus laevis TaxID=8355 RepID=A0A974CRP9_XENLA|nr:hypothetical protein XELAEV_18028744mg [Xenopus laevis]
MEEDPHSELIQKAVYENNGLISDQDGRDGEKPEKDVLLQFSNQPCYRIARNTIFRLIVIATLAFIAATIMVYPKSFKDSNNDGSGDLKGVQEKIDHFLYLDIKNIWVAPFYKSSLKDFNYAVDEFMEVDPTLGTMADFESMIAAMHDKGGGQVVPPNNWHVLVSFYGNSAWEYDDARKQCYLHQFKKEQPDLNFNNPDVNEGFLNITKFWLEKGVDGFTINSVKFLLEADHIRDEHQVNKLQNPDTISNYSELFHDYTTTQVGMHDIIPNFRQTINKYSREPGRYRCMGTESNDQAAVDKIMLYYGNSFMQEADFPLNSYLFDLNKGNFDGASVFSMVDLWMKATPSGKWPNWMELGMEDGSPQVNTDNSQEYNPKRWDSSFNAVFSGANKTWLSVNPDYMAVNVETQKNEQHSTLNLYRELNNLRNKEVPLHRGWLCYTWIDSDVFAYVRELDGLNKVFMMVLNFGRATTINMRQAVPDLPGEAKIRLSTEGSRVGKAVSTDSIQTQPGEGLILEYKTNKPVHVKDTFKDKCFIYEKACYTSTFDLLYNRC